MEGKKVEVHLFTPILVEGGEGAGGGSHPKALVKLIGVISQILDGGVLLEISEGVEEKGQKLALPQRSLFLPYHKIDHLFSIS